MALRPGEEGSSVGELAPEARQTLAQRVSAGTNGNPDMSPVGTADCSTHEMICRVSGARNMLPKIPGLTPWANFFRPSGAVWRR